VVALGEVLTDPAPGSDADNPYWVRPPAPDDVEERVLIRYVVPPGLPLLTRGEPDPVLDALSVSRARGGTVFAVTPGQWTALVAAAGGWPTPAGAPAEVDEVRRAVEEQAGRRPAGQGRQTDPRVRLAVEAHAMALAARPYAGQGWSVEDVSARESYDLRCTRSDGTELRVEVKGTTGAGAAVLLTPNEVAHARTHYPAMALIVVAGIWVAEADDGPPRASGGVPHVHEPWRIDDGTLVPVGYEYRPPAGS
jgi:hypothetical protein